MSNVIALENDGDKTMIILKDENDRISNVVLPVGIFHLKPTKANDLFNSPFDELSNRNSANA
jgi:hypothetical protein